MGPTSIDLPRLRSAQHVGNSQRQFQRHLVPIGISATLTPSGGEGVAVTLRDVNRSGACVARSSRYEIATGSYVRLDIRDTQSGESLSSRATVRWLRFGGFNTYIGLRFVPGPLREGSMLDRYMSEDPGTT